MPCQGAASPGWAGMAVHLPNRNEKRGFCPGVNFEVSLLAGNLLIPAGYIKSSLKRGAPEQKVSAVRGRTDHLPRWSLRRYLSSAAHLKLPMGVRA